MVPAATVTRSTSRTAINTTPDTVKNSSKLIGTCCHKQSRPNGVGSSYSLQLACMHHTAIYVGSHCKLNHCCSPQKNPAVPTLTLTCNSPGDSWDARQNQGIVCVVGVPQWLNPGIARTSDGIRVYVADGVIQLAFLGQITQSLFTATTIASELKP